MTEGPAGSAPLEWSVLVDGPLPGALNMARDHALALSLAPGRAALRLYRWVSPTLSLGRNEPALGRFERSAFARVGVDLVRRPTGGRSVLHHRELTYAVVLPVGAAAGIRESYLAVNRALGRGLASLGVAAEIAGDAAGAGAPRPDAGPCFRLPAPGEVTASGRKLVGSAQARIGRVLLQHGSILLADDQGLIAELAERRGPDASGGARLATGSAPAAMDAPATLADLLDRVPDWDALHDAVVAGFREELGGAWGGGPPELDAREENRRRNRYASETWTWRR